MRLGSDTRYKRPDKTYQETLTENDIKDKLRDYAKVDDLTTVPLQTHLRYFVYRENPTTKKTERLFRLGGRLVNKDKCDKYVVLSNGNHSWSVNTSTAVFFRELRVNEVREKYEGIVQHLKDKIERLKRS